MVMRKHSIGLGVALAGALLLGASPMASANSFGVKTDDRGESGGAGRYKDGGDIIKACDIDADGKRAVVRWKVPSLNRSGKVVNTKGAGTCKRANRGFREGRRIVLTVWIQNGPGGRHIGTDSGAGHT